MDWKDGNKSHVQKKQTGANASVGTCVLPAAAWQSNRVESSEKCGRKQPEKRERVNANAYIYMRGNFSLGCLRFMRYLGVLDCVYNVPGYRSSYWYYYLNTSIFGHILKSIVSGSAEFGDLVLIICEMVSRSERWNNWLLLHCQLNCRECAYRNPHSTSPRAIDQFTHRERETEREWQTDRLTDRQIDRHIGFDIDTSIRYMDRHRSIKCC